MTPSGHRAIVGVAGMGCLCFLIWLTTGRGDCAVWKVVALLWMLLHLQPSQPPEKKT